ncbi:MAG: Uma2 family endonuclease [Firmicutes bacterium]|nr:Uma2 family endonuclease [Bacillota bacterium]
MNADNLEYEIYDEVYDELIGGEIVVMTPRPAVNHNMVSGNIFYVLKKYFDGKPCIPFGDGVDLYLSEENRFVPDGMIVCDRDKIKSDGVYGAPDMVIEVLSPSTAKNDKSKKKDAYEKAGVREYWIVNTMDKSIEVYLLKNGRFILDNIYSVYPEYLLKKMNDEERAAVETEFKCSLFDDLVIKLDDIFKNMF